MKNKVKSEKLETIKGSELITRLSEGSTYLREGQFVKVNLPRLHESYAYGEFLSEDDEKHINRKANYTVYVITDKETGAVYGYEVKKAGILLWLKPAAIGAVAVLLILFIAGELAPDVQTGGGTKYEGEVEFAENDILPESTEDLIETVKEKYGSVSVPCFGSMTIPPETENLVNMVDFQNPLANRGPVIGSETEGKTTREYFVSENDEKVYAGSRVLTAVNADGTVIGTAEGEITATDDDLKVSINRTLDGEWPKDIKDVTDCERYYLLGSGEKLYVNQSVAVSRSESEEILINDDTAADGTELYSGKAAILMSSENEVLAVLENKLTIDNSTLSIDANDIICGEWPEGLDLEQTYTECYVFADGRTLEVGQYMITVADTKDNTILSAEAALDIDRTNGTAKFDVIRVFEGVDTESVELKTEEKYYLRYTLYLVTEDGTEALWESDFLRVGDHIRTIEIAHGLSEGDYELIVVCQPYRLTGGELESTPNNVSAKAELHVISGGQTL